jgi:nucleoside-diphosphate-sugar epimerase
MICEIAGHQDVKFVHDLTRPSGPKVKLMDITKAKQKVGFNTQVSLGDGLRESVKWFVDNVQNKNINS